MENVRNKYIINAIARGLIPCYKNKIKEVNSLVMIYKKNPRLACSEIYSYIASNSETGLKREQVKECFQIYHDMIVDLVTSNYFDKDMTIILPHIGNFSLRYYKGRKSGSTYSFFNNKVTLDKSEPSYYVLKFKTFRTLCEIVRNKTKHYE